MPGSSPGLCGCEVGSALAGVAARPGLLEELPTAQVDTPSRGEAPNCPGMALPSHAESQVVTPAWASRGQGWGPPGSWAARTADVPSRCH